MKMLERLLLVVLLIVISLYAVSIIDRASSNLLRKEVNSLEQTIEDPANR